MGPSLDKLIFLLIFVKISVIESRALLGGCSCATSVPLAVTIPVAPPPLVLPCATHGYKIEVPPAPAVAAAKVEYLLDMVVEAPVPPIPPPVCNPNLLTPILAAPLPAPDCDEPVALPAPCAACAAAAPCAACAAAAAPPAAPLPLPLPLALPAPLPAALPLPLPAALPAALPLPAAPALPALAALPALQALAALSALALPALPALAAAAAPPALADDFSGVAPLTAPLPAPVTYQLIAKSLPAAPAAPLAPAFSLPLSSLTSPCACGKCPPAKPACRYVLKGFTSNKINRGRSRRDVSAQKKKITFDELRDFIKSLKQQQRVPRKAKKCRLVKRDIKGEYDLLQREQSQMDLTIPEIIQYMPETMMPNFKRGKCNIGCNNGCKNCINNDLNINMKTFSSPLPAVAAADAQATNKENDQTNDQRQLMNENTKESPNQRFGLSPRSANGENYSKRSVNPFQNPNPSFSGSGPLPPPCSSDSMELTELAQNPGNPVWYQPQPQMQPLTDPNVEYVYDRLGHKYEVKNGSFKLVTPENNENDNGQENRSTQGASVKHAEKPSPKVEVLESSVRNAGPQQMLDEEVQQIFQSAVRHNAFVDVNAPSQLSDVINDQSMTQTPVVGAAPQHGPSHDAHMDKIIRDIVYQHPDFIDATQHAPGSLTLPEGVTREETVQFLDKLIRGRLSKWFVAPTEEVPMHSLQDLNRYSRETGTSIKFIPIVTVDKDRLDKFRQTNSAGTP